MELSRLAAAPDVSASLICSNKISLNAETANRP